MTGNGNSERIRTCDSQNAMTNTRLNTVDATCGARQPSRCNTSAHSRFLLPAAPAAAPSFLRRWRNRKA